MANTTSPVVLDATMQTMNTKLDNIVSAIQNNKVTVVDNLESESATDVLSAKQGKVLDEKKINEPETEGTNGQILTTDGNGNRTWEDAPTSGTTNYDDLVNKPKINNVEVTSANATGTVYGLVDAPSTLIENGFLKFNGTTWVSERIEIPTPVDDYTFLDNKPKINNVELTGNKTSADLGITESPIASVDPTYFSLVGKYLSFSTDAQKNLSVFFEQIPPNIGYVLSVEDEKGNIGFHPPTVKWSNVDNTPTTLSGYGITDAIKEPTSEGTNGQVLTTDGNGGRTWTTVEGGGSSAKSVVGTIVANSKTVTLTSDDLKNDNATYEFFFEPVVDSEGKYEKVVLASYTLDTTTGTMILTVQDAPTVNTRIRVDVTAFTEV